MKNVAKFATLAIAGSLVIGGGALSAQAESAYNSTAVAGITLSVNDYVASVEDEAPAVVAQTPAADTTEETAEVKTEVEDKNADFVAANVDNAVNVRKKKSTESTIVGQMYKGDTGKLLKKGDEWSKIESGNVKGWVKNEFLLFGTQAKEYADKICSKKATVTTTTLNVRTKKSTEADILTQIPEGETYEVAKISKDGEWVKIWIDDVKGYVSADFVTVETNYGKALTMEEIEEIQRQNEEAEAAAAQDETVTVTEEVTQTNSSAVNPVSTIKPSKKKTIKKSNSSSSGSSFSDDSSVSTSSSSSSSSGSAVASTALQYNGGRYVWGGATLGQGVDCSGFTMCIYQKYGISLPHNAAAQSGYGKRVSTSSLQPGDLVFYSHGGGIDHVGIYIGGGQIIHASNSKDGIKISNAFYRKPVCASRLFN